MASENVVMKFNFTMVPFVTLSRLICAIKCIEKLTFLIQFFLILNSSYRATQFLQPVISLSNEQAVCSRLSDNEGDRSGKSNDLERRKSRGDWERKGEKIPVRLFLTDKFRPHLPLIGFYFQNVNSVPINRNHVSYKRKREVIAYGLWIRIFSITQLVD